VNQKENMRIKGNFFIYFYQNIITCPWLQCQPYFAASLGAPQAAKPYFLFFNRLLNSGAFNATTFKGTKKAAEKKAACRTFPTAAS